MFLGIRCSLEGLTQAGRQGKVILSTNIFYWPRFFNKILTAVGRKHNILFGLNTWKSVQG